MTQGRLHRQGALLRKAALAYPNAYEERPWGHHAIKVNGKAFVFLAADAETFSLSTKLPSSAGVALKLPFASFGAAVLLLQPYSADFPGTAYAKPARRFLHAAIHHDSLALDRVSASATAVEWGLQVGRTHPDSLAAWAGPTHTFIAKRRADTAEVLVYPAGEPCSQVPIVLRFVGTGSRARVVHASSACLTSGR